MPSGEKSTLRGEMSANGFSSALAPCRTIGIRKLYLIPKSQEKYSTVSPTSTNYSKKIIGDKAFKKRFPAVWQSHRKNLPNGRPKDAEQSRNRSVSFFGLLGIFFAINRVYLRYQVEATSSASEILRLRKRKQRRKKTQYETTKTKVYHPFLCVCMYSFTWARELFQTNGRGFGSYVAGERCRRLQKIS